MLPLAPEKIEATAPQLPVPDALNDFPLHRGRPMMPKAPRPVFRTENLRNPPWLIFSQHYRFCSGICSPPRNFRLSGSERIIASRGAAWNALNAVPAALLRYDSSLPKSRLHPMNNPIISSGKNRRLPVGLSLQVCCSRILEQPLDPNPNNPAVWRMRRDTIRSGDC